MKTKYNIIFPVILGLCFFQCQPSAGFDLRHENIIGTHYTSSTWAPSFWSNFDTNEIYDDFNEIKANGFNTIILVVPWVGFQSSITPVAYHEEYFQLLDRMCRISRELGLNIVLRVGYVHEMGVKSNPGYVERMINVLTDEKILDAWLNYLDRINKTVDNYDNFLFGFLTWEDFFFLDFFHYNLETRKYLSLKTGYQDYLKQYKLRDISDIYGENFSSYTEIPVPAYKTPGVKLFYEFWDNFLITLFEKSKNHFPRLSMEVRVDCDPSEKDSEYICHKKVFDLGGKADITVIYYNPAWGSANNGDQITADEAAARFQRLIEWVGESTGNLIFIDQFNFVDNTPGFEHNTKIIPGQVPEFINKSAPVINNGTIGYSLWSMKDVRANYIINNSFERDNQGWQIKNGQLTLGKDNKVHRVRLEDKGELKQHIIIAIPEWGVSSIDREQLFFKFLFKAKSAEGEQPADLKIKISDNKGNSIFQGNTAISGNSFTTIAFDKVPVFLDGLLSIENSGGNVVLDEFELYYRDQENGIYDISGNPKSFCGNIIQLNQYLAAGKKIAEYYTGKNAGEAIDGLYDDGWAAGQVSGIVLTASNNRDFIVETFVPDSWQKYNNKITLMINDVVIGSANISPGYNKLHFAVKTGNEPKESVSFKIIADKVYLPSHFNADSRDKRKLSFILVGAGFKK